MYRFDPYKDVTEAQKKLVLGGQAQLWAEQTDETNLEPTMWPRAAAVAELFWTGAGASGFPRSQSDSGALFSSADGCRCPGGYASDERCEIPHGRKGYSGGPAAATLVRPPTQLVQLGGA